MSQFDWILGLDEVGAGCLAGPVVAAAFAYETRYAALELPVRVFDSKALSEKRRIETDSWLRQWDLANFHISEVSAEEIDEINILRARFKAMALSAQELLKKIPVNSRVGIFVDGSIMPPEISNILNQNQNAWSVVKGDSKNFAIAAASILAKTYRDNLMCELAKTYPEY